MTFLMYFDRLEGQGISVNIVSTVGAGQVRACVMGYENRTPTKEEMKRMKELVDQAMRQGAVGLSSGLIYTPNSYFSTEELISLAQIAARYGKIYLTHIRGEYGRLLTALKEAIRIGRQAEVPVEVLHFKRSSIPIGKEPDPSIQEAAALIEKAREEGVSIYANLHPYAASQTSLSVRLPEWSREGGPTKLVQRLRDPRTRNRIREELSELVLQRNRWSHSGDDSLWLHHTRTASPLSGHANLRDRRQDSGLSCRSHADAHRQVRSRYESRVLCHA